MSPDARALGVEDYRALAYRLLGRGLAELPLDAIDIQYEKAEMDMTRRLWTRSQPRAKRQLRPAWRHPWVIPFPDDTFVSSPHPLAVVLAASRWALSASFTAKRWVMGGGRSVSTRSPDTTTRLLESLVAPGDETTPEGALINALNDVLLIDLRVSMEAALAGIGAALGKESDARAVIAAIRAARPDRDGPVVRRVE